MTLPRPRPLRTLPFPSLAASPPVPRHLFYPNICLSTHLPASLQRVYRRRLPTHLSSIPVFPPSSHQFRLSYLIFFIVRIVVL
ncbi:hypothetical protein E2C01_019442 [Portunus trituberculatus]|uniref:Uncharacterized protein n=1 Tax=Portunus trituberculatus TaxID=210409 RepID=A0A5B7DYZ7_PORTR|nr:hypothetical protein [Portunus trituberculatus]